MKIRTDFVTNSSSSSFVVEIEMELTNGAFLRFEGTGGTAETGRVDYFEGDATVSVSPKQLGSAANVEELIQLLTDGVTDKTVDWEGTGDYIYKPIFAESNPVEGMRGKIYDAYGFIEAIRENVKTMNDINSITIRGEELMSDMEEYNREYTYNLKTGEYAGQQMGEDPMDREGSSGGDLTFSLAGCSVSYNGEEPELEEDEDEEDDWNDEQGSFVMTYDDNGFCITDDNPQLPGMKVLEGFDETKFSGTVLTIPDGVNYIGGMIFMNLPQIEEVIIPKSVQEIEMAAFLGLDGLKRIRVPESLIPSIQGGAFMGCPSDTEIETY